MCEAIASDSVKTRIVAYFKRYGITEERLVNRLLVSLYAKYNEINVVNNTRIRDLIIESQEELNSSLSELQGIIQKHDFTSITIETLVNCFEFVISPSDRVVNGSVYTPKDIRQRIIHECLDDVPVERLQAIRIADISCGGGGFLLDVAEYLHERTGNSYAHIFHNNIFGIDIQGYSIERTKILLSLLALSQGEDSEFEFNLESHDTLLYDFGQIEPFDVVLGNPPYVCWRNLPEETRNRMRQFEVCRCGNSDLYIPFFQIAIESLRDGGRLGYIVMNTFLTSLNGTALREYLHARQYKIQVVDFRDQQIFKGKNTYTCLFFLKKQYAGRVAYCTIEQSELERQFAYSYMDYATLVDKGGWRLNDMHHVADYERHGIAIGEYCDSRHGIATLSNKTYIFTPIGEDEAYYHLSKNGRVYRIEKDICRDIVNSNKFNSDVTLEKIKEKVIFPYRLGVEGRMEVVPLDEFRVHYPNVYSYLQSQRNELKKRDKGKQEKYPVWYAFGRTQSMILPRYKLFFSKIANHSLKCVLSDDSNLLLYNGMAFVSDNHEKLQVLQKVLQSDIFWSYVTTNAKPYASGYVSLNGDNIKHFHIPNFSAQEKAKLLSFRSQSKVNKWLIQFYPTYNFSNNQSQITNEK